MDAADLRTQPPIQNNTITPHGRHPPVFYNEAGEPVRGERQRTVKTTYV